MTLNFKRCGQKREVLKVLENGGVPFLTFPLLTESGLVRHGFSTRLGGVSRPPYDTMNLSFTRGDRTEDVKENYRRMAAALEISVERMVLTQQTHTVNVRKVTEADAGKGVIRERDYADVDGLITNVPGISLVAFGADCVTLFFLDPVHRAIGLSHSGWRGTVNRMGEVTLQAMAREYGTCPEDVLVCIGPSICRSCYEVGSEVAEEFLRAFGAEHQADLMDKKENGKYQLDLWAANRRVLTEAGVKEERIQVTDICTFCNPQLLFSHRRTGEKRGNLGAFLCLNEE
ncbi:MAG: peptidoglycan editing factor PgeF [Otoolea sp.]